MVLVGVSIRDLKQQQVLMDQILSHVHPQACTAFSVWKRLISFLLARLKGKPGGQLWARR